MDTTCLVTHAYLNTVRNLYDFNLVQYEIWVDPLNELLDRAEHSDNSRLVQHQRAFYCIELMLFRFVMRHQPNWCVQDAAAAAWLQWERSREGLNYVLEKANAVREDLVAEVTERYYLNERAVGANQMEQDEDHQRSKLYKLICESCVILRQALKNEELTLARVGKRLALASSVSTFYIDDMLLFGEELLEQTEGMTRRAWQLPTR